MKTRDFYYTEDRLLAPCVGAMQAHERLKSLNHHEQARRLADAMKVLYDVARDLRRELILERNQS